MPFPDSQTILARPEAASKCSLNSHKPLLCPNPYGYNISQRDPNLGFGVVDHPMPAILPAIVYTLTHTSNIVPGATPSRDQGTS